MQKHLVVAAIDFGTTYSGWAYSFRHEFERDPVQVSSKNWTGGPVVTPKAPTCVLIKSDGKTLDSFGYQAEKNYAELSADDSHKGFYFFRHFKMMLYGRIGIERKIKLEDMLGRTLPAKTVFGLAIKYLKDDLMKTAASRIGEEILSTEDVLWVLTVPAIWNDAARHFMREAAQEAGIDGDRLLICLEPEAASLFCRCLPLERSHSKGGIALAEFQPGTKYLVLDAGGGTVDITVHEVLSDYNLRELYKASGGDWGGTKVDIAFEDFLGEVLGKTVLQKFKRRHMEDYTELLWDFEIKKKAVTFENNKTIIRFSVSLSDLVLEITGQTVKECVMKSRFKESIIVSGDKLRIGADVMRNFFQGTTEKIIDHLAQLLTKPTVYGCSAIVMAGGFSEAHILQQKFRERFGSMKIIIPEEAGLAVLKGAVIYGHSPDVIAERVCRFTYGRSTTHKSSSARCMDHPPCRKKVDRNGDLRCYDLFQIHVKAGQTVKNGDEGEEHASHPVYHDQTEIENQIYVSSNPNPIFVTDDGCTKIGHFDIDVPYVQGIPTRERKFGIKFLFWGTEIMVKVEDKDTGIVTKKYVDFLG